MMRWTPTARGLLLALLVISATIVPSQAGEPGLIGWWKLAGNTDDASGRSRHGVNHDADLNASGPGGKSAGAAAFNGRGQFIEIPAGRSPRIGSGEFSIGL